MAALDFLYAFMIAPLRGAMEIVLAWAYALTGSWGWAIVLLSLAVNIVLLPVYHLAESWQEDERSLQKRMAPKLAEIKAVYKGRERYMFTRAIYRMFGYHPLMALRTSLGLLIQIPFFFAAYNLLHGNAALAGVPFFFIKNLGQPDALLSLGSFSANLLPFVMTAVNLASAAVYSARLTRRDKIQLYGLAALFLLLLYTAAAGLLLYWTCNNIFSFFKNIYYRRYVYEDSRQAGSAWPGALSRVKRLPARAFEALARFTPFWLELLFAATSVALLARMTSSPWKWAFYLEAAIPSFLLATLVALLAAARAWRDADKDRLRREILFPCLVFCALVAVLILASYNDRKILNAHRVFYSSLNVANIGLLLFWVLNMRFTGPLLARGAGHLARFFTPQSARSLYMASSFMGAVLLFFYHPSGLFYSDPEFFITPLPAILGNLLFRALIFVGVCLFIFRKSGEQARPILAVAAGWFCLCAVFFSFIAVFDYGEMNGPFLPYTNKFTSPLAVAVDIAILTGSGILMALILRLRRAGLLTGALQSLCVVLALASGAQLWLSGPQDLTGEASVDLPDYHKRFFSLSQAERNILVIVLDAFTGDHMEKFIAEEPELIANFTGFTWYADNISPGRRTSSSIPGIAGGERFLPSEVNKRADKPLREMLMESYSVLPNLLLPQGYDVSMAIDLHGLDQGTLATYCPRLSEVLLPLNMDKDFLYRWHKLNGYGTIGKSNQAGFMSIFGLFKASPSFVRKHVYREGSWLHADTTAGKASSNWYAAHEAMGELVTAENPRPSFRFIHSQVTHVPWDLDADCMPLEKAEEDVASSRHPDGYFTRHYWAERCALRSIATLLQRLKEQGIYDNTQIVLLSDHSQGDSISYKSLPAPYGANIRDASALFMVKNFNEDHPFAVDRSLPTMSSDLLALICRETGFCKDEKYYDPWDNQGRERKRVFSSGFSNFSRHNKNSYIIDSYIVDGLFGDPANWQQLEAGAKVP